MPSPQNNPEQTMQTPNAIGDQETALRWIIDHRRPEVSFGEAAKILRFALGGNPEGLSILAGIEADQTRSVESDAQTQSGNRASD
jgi:hypothetical protein